MHQSATAQSCNRKGCHNKLPHQCLQAKHDLHVLDWGNQSGQKSVQIFHKVDHSFKVLYVPVLDDGIHLGRSDTEAPRILKAQRLQIQFWQHYEVQNCRRTRAIEKNNYWKMKFHPTQYLKQVIVLRGTEFSTLKQLHKLQGKCDNNDHLII